MSITALVENGAIKLPEGLSVPNGTKVEITLPESVLNADEKWMLQFAGCIDGPEDFAAEHDHYIHGAAKRFDK